MKEVRKRARQKPVEPEDITFDFLWLVIPVGKESRKELFARFVDFETRVKERETTGGRVELIKLKDKHELRDVLKVVDELKLNLTYYRQTYYGSIVKSVEALARREVNKLIEKEV